MTILQNPAISSEESSRIDPLGRAGALSDQTQLNGGIRVGEQTDRDYRTADRDDELFRNLSSLSLGISGNLS